MDKLYQDNATGCLADHCDVLGCDQYLSSPIIKPCREEEVKIRRHRCRTIFDQCHLSSHECEKLACGPTHSLWNVAKFSKISRDSLSDGSSSMRTVVLVLLGIGMVMYYGIVFSSRRATTKRDFRLSKRRTSGFSALFSWRSQSSKGGSID